MPASGLQLKLNRSLDCTDTHTTSLFELNSKQQAELSSLVAAAKVAASQAARLQLLDREVSQLQRLLHMIKRQVWEGSREGTTAMAQQVGVWLVFTSKCPN